MRRPTAAGDRFEGRRPSVVGAAYTNPDTDPDTGTTLYDIDADLDVLVVQDPPNDGTLRTIGGLGANALTLVGFDITESTHGVTALRPRLSLRGRSSLYVLDLSSGRAYRIGTIGGDEPIRDIAIRVIGR